MRRYSDAKRIMSTMSTISKTRNDANASQKKAPTSLEDDDDDPLEAAEA
jgi:hypothetical protein